MVIPQELLILLTLTLSPCLAQFCSWDSYTASATKVNMKGCRLTELPPAPASLTAVETLLLNSNPFNQFPNITALAGSLLSFEIGGSGSARAPFSIIDDDLITPLVNLQSINIGIANLEVFPNLTMAGHSLTRLQIVDCRFTVIPPEISTSFTKLTHVNFYAFKLNHFPDFRNSGASLRDLRLKFTRITDIPVELTAPLVALDLFDVTGNRLTKFPDFTSSNATMRLFHLDQNSITDPPARLVTPFTALQNVDFSRNLLTQLPDLTNSASTLELLVINNNQISALPARLLRPLVNLQKLYVNDNPITAFPHLPGLTKLEFLSVANTHITQLPPLWPQDLGSMTLQLEGSTLDLCSCRNLWIKKTQAMYSALTFTDQMCASGQSWSSYTMDGLRADCADDKQQKRVKSGLTEKASLSPQPGPTLLLHSYLPGSDRPTCINSCLQTASCVGFWLSPAGCVISAPTAGDPVTVPGVGHPVWTFYGINMIQFVWE